MTTRLSTIAAIALGCTVGLTHGPAVAVDADGFQIPGGRVVGDDSDRLEIGIGAFNVITNDGPSSGVFDDDTETEARIEYRMGEKIYGVGPKIGLLGNSADGVYGYLGLYSDLRFGNWVVSPSAGAGGYHEGDGKDLGGVFQFVLALDGAYEFESGERIGLKLSHISNAGLHSDNPGVESVLVTYSVPFDRLLQ